MPPLDSFLALTHLSPSLVLDIITGLFCATFSGVFSPHPISRVPIVCLAALVGAYLGQTVAASNGRLPTFGDFEPIGATLGALFLIVVVRRIFP